MQRFFGAAAVLAATAGAAWASPQETFTQNANWTGTFQSNGLANAGNNGVATFTATGGYTLRHIRLTGTWTENPANTITFPKEACLLVTPPSGQPFIMEPLLQTDGTTLNIDASYFAVPLAGTVDPAGVWTIRFFELYDDGGTTYDADWTNLTIVFDDANPPLTGSYPGAIATATFTDVPSDLLTGTSTETRTYVHAGSETVNAFAINGIAEAITGYTANSTVSPVSDVRVGVTPPGGTEIVITPFVNPCFSAQDGIILGSLPAPQSANGTWTLRFFESADIAAGVDNMWKSVTLSLISVAAPTVAAELFPESDPGNFVEATATITNPGDVAWFLVHVPSGVTGASGMALDLDTQGSSLSAVNDTAMAIFSSTGARIASDFDDHHDMLSQLTFGSGRRNATGGFGFAYNGRDGANLAGGDYYVAVCGGNAATFQPIFWGVSSPTPNTGSVKLRARWIPFGTFIDTPATVTDLNPESVSPGTWVEGTAALGVTDIAWFKVNVPSGVLNTSGQALDMDTEGSTLSPANNTFATIYNGVGTVRLSDDDDGSDLLSQFSYGAGNRNPAGNSLRYNGRDGTTLPGGTYYVAVSGAPATTATNFAQSTTTANTGSVKLRARYWGSNAPSEGPPTVGTLQPELNPGNFVSLTTNVPAGQVRWVKIEIPSGVTGAAGQALDIDTEGTLLSPTNNPNISLYNPDGTVRTSDNDDGTDLQAQLTYGAGRRNGPGNAQAYNGRDAATLPAGNYYLAISGSPGTAATGFAYTTTSTEAGDITVRARYYPSNAPLEAPTVIEDLGVIDGPDGLSRVVDITELNVLRWYKFTILQECSNTTTFYLDIDTTPTDSTNLDTEIGVYRTDGTLVASDDDDGSPSGVGYSALSFGATTPVRDYSGIGLGGQVNGNGRDGAVFPAGTYYIVVGRFNVNFGATGWGASSTATLTGIPVKLNFRTNLPPSGPTACSIADIATEGNPDVQAGPDGFITGVDADAFIECFNNLTRKALPSDPPGGPYTGPYIADVIGDLGVGPPNGFVEGVDADAFFEAYFIGC